MGEVPGSHEGAGIRVAEPLLELAGVAEPAVEQARDNPGEGWVVARVQMQSGRRNI